MSAARAGTQGLLKRAWNEIPDIVAGTGLAVAGLVLAGIGVTNYYSKDGDNRRYKMTYVVMRPDDPRAEKVHKD